MRRALRAPFGHRLGRRERMMREGRRRRLGGSPAVVMVLENSRYPLDSRVRKEAESLVEAGLSVEVLAPRENDRPVHESIRGVQVTRFRLIEGHGELLGTAVEYITAFVAITAAVLPRLARSRQGTLHVHNPPDMLFPLLLLARWRGWSTVFDHHDDAAGLLRVKLGRRTPIERVLVWMRNRSARVSDLTITTNETQRQLVRAAARRVLIVRNSPPAWFYDYSPSAPTGCVRLVFLGEIGVQDRVVRTVDILASLVNERGCDAELLIIGDGPQRCNVEERAKHHGVESRLKITGWVPYEDVPALLATAHVGLDTAALTAVNHGSTMIKVLEYLAVGLPVVATALHETRVTGGDALVAVTEDSVEAFIAPLMDLIGSSEAWDECSARARLRGSELQWATQARGLIAAYGALTTPADCAFSRFGSSSQPTYRRY